jgi:acyl carrier protein
MGLDTVELLMAIEEEFGIDVPNEDAATLETAGDISLCVLKLLEAKGAQPSPGATWERVRSIITYQLGVKLEEVTPEARIVHDLGAD